MKYFCAFFFIVFLIFSCTNDSLSDVSPQLPVSEDITLHELFWQNSSISTNQQLTINVGDTVRWTWGSGTHNLRSTSGVENFNSDFHSNEGFQYLHEFTQIGATQYVCDPHPSSMFGTITVTE